MANKLNVLVAGASFMAILAFGLNGCKCSHDEKKTTDVVDGIESIDSLPYPGVIFLLPTPSEVLYATFENDVSFISGLTAPADKEKEAISSNQQALLLGVYLTDLSYNIIFKNHQEVLNNISTIQSLSVKLGVGSVLYDRFLKRIETNFNSLDSMEVVFNDFSQNSYSVIENLGNYRLLSLVAMGSGIEAMFLGYKSLNKKDINSLVLPYFSGQSFIYENYYKNFINYNYRSSDLKSFINDVDIVYSLFKRNISSSSELNVSEVKDSHFKINSSRDDKPFVEKKINELGDSIVIVREKLINLKYQ